MKKKYYISYPEILNLIRRMKMLSPTEEKTKLPKTNKSKPNLPFTCAKIGTFFNFYTEINPKDNDRF